MLNYSTTDLINQDNTVHATRVPLLQVLARFRLVLLVHVSENRYHLIPKKRKGIHSQKTTRAKRKNLGMKSRLAKVDKAK